MNKTKYKIEGFYFALLSILFLLQNKCNSYILQMGLKELTFSVIIQRNVLHSFFAGEQKTEVKHLRDLYNLQEYFSNKNPPMREKNIRRR